MAVRLVLTQLRKVCEFESHRGYVNKYLVKSESKALVGVVARTLFVNLSVHFLGNYAIRSLGRVEEKITRRRHPIGFVDKRK
jgi:hypothetical protein